MKSLPDFRTDEERHLFGLIRGGSPDEFHQLLNSEINVNAVNANGMTMLHLAAAYGGRPYVLSLLKTGRCDLSLRDSAGRYAYQLAIESARDFAMARLLMWQQMKQVDAMNARAPALLKSMAQRNAGDAIRRTMDELGTSIKPVAYYRQRINDLLNADKKKKEDKK